LQYEALVEEIINYVNPSHLNTVTEIGTDQIFDSPLVGIVSADDPLFDQLKDPLVVGENYILPGEWLDGAKSVIAYFCPFRSRSGVLTEVRGFRQKSGYIGALKGNSLMKH